MINNIPNSSLEIENYRKKVRLEFDRDLAVPEMIEEVIAPALIAMGYFPTNVYRALNMTETLEVIESVVKEGRLYD